MPGDRVQVGQGWFSARTWNRFCDLLSEWERGAFVRKTDPVIGPAATDTIFVRNDTGSARRVGDVVGVGAKLLTDFKADSPWLKGETPAATHRVFAVLLESAPWVATADSRPIIRAQVSGQCLAYVNFYAPADMGCAPSPGEYVFRSSSGGGPFQVLTAPTSTSEQLVPVLLGRMSDDLTVLTPSGGIPARMGATLTGVSCAVYYNAGTGLTRTRTSAGYSVDVFNEFLADIPGDRYVKTRLNWDGSRYVSGVSCAAEA